MTDFIEATIKTYSGLSSETKPTKAGGTDVPNGSRWREIDTGKKYHFNEHDDTWYLKYDPTAGVPPTYSKVTSSAGTFPIQKGQLNKLRLRPQIINEHAESSRNTIGTVTSTNIVGQIFKASQDNINGINLTLESALGTSFDDFESYADSAALQAAWVASNGAFLATLELAVIHGGTKSMRLPGNATVGAEWVKTITPIDYTGFTGTIFLYQTTEYSSLKLDFFIGDGANTKSTQLIATSSNNWLLVEFSEPALVEDGGGTTDTTAITKVGFRLADKSVSSFIYIDDTFAIPPPGSISLKLWDMGASIPESTVTSIDDGTQYEKLGDAGITGLQLSSIDLQLLGGKRLYHVNTFIAGVALEIPTNEILIPDNYYALTVNYVDTDTAVYGPNSSWDDYYINGYSFTAPDEATAITATGSQEDIMFNIFSTQDIYIIQMAQFIDEPPNGESDSNFFIEDKNMKVTDIILSGAQAVQAIIQDREQPEFMAKGGKFEEYYNDDFTDSVTSINLGFRYKFEPNTPHG